MIKSIAKQRGASDIVNGNSVLSNPADAKNISSLGHCDKDIWTKDYPK